MQFLRINDDNDNDNDDVDDDDDDIPFTISFRKVSSTYSANETRILSYCQRPYPPHLSRGVIGTIIRQTTWRVFP